VSSLVVFIDFNPSSARFLRIMASVAMMIFSEFSMYATLREYEGIENPEDLQRLLKDGLLAEMEALPGFVAYYFVDVGDAGDRMISLTIFESREAAEQSNRLAGEWVERWITDNPFLATIFSRFDAGPVISIAKVAGH
jgi:hypothetical protein